MTWILFYKRLVTLGGAEVLLDQHYNWLKEQGKEVKVISFEIADLERISIASEDLIVLQKVGAVAQIRALAFELKKNKNARVICHSGYLDLGLAAWIARVEYSIFVHQPTTMSFNETDKFAVRFWPRYQKFSNQDHMYQRLSDQRASFSFTKRLYIELRSYLSQALLRNAKALFVLSEYAVREKREIFSLETTYLSGAITSKQVAALANQPELKPLGEQIELVSVSRIDENKRIEILISAVAELKARGHNVQLRLGGKGPATNELLALAAELNVNEAIKFLGFVPENDIHALYNEMDLFVTIDWADYRITTYEVLAVNRRVVVSDDTDFNPGLVSSGYLFTSAPKPSALADCIERALETPLTWDRSQLAEYLTSFTWSIYFGRIGAVVEGRNA